MVSGVRARAPRSFCWRRGGLGGNYRYTVDNRADAGAAAASVCASSLPARLRRRQMVTWPGGQGRRIHYTWTAACPAPVRPRSRWRDPDAATPCARAWCATERRWGRVAASFRRQRGLRGWSSNLRCSCCTARSGHLAAWTTPAGAGFGLLLARGRRRASTWWGRRRCRPGRACAPGASSLYFPKSTR